jgi:hypothetical protein
VLGVLEPTVSRPSPSTAIPTRSVFVATTSIRKSKLRRVQRTRPHRFLRPEVSTLAAGSS